MPTSELYKVKKGDTLTSIAKQFGHRKWETIWNAADNKSLVSKRKKPEAIEPGDQLTIPPNEAKRKQAENLQQSLDDHVSRLTRQLKITDELIKYEREATEKIVKDLEDNLKNMKKWSKGVDAAATVATALVDLRKSIGEAAKLGKKAIGANEKELKDILKEATKGSKDLAKDQAKDQLTETAAKLLEEHKEDSNEVVAFAGCMADAYEKYLLPSFWAGTITQMMDGKSWSDAVSTDLAEELEDRIKSIKAESAQRLKQFEAKRNLLAGQLQQSKTIGKQAAQNAKVK
jgi:hypothetical protein